MNIAGRLSRRGSLIAVRHVAEVLAGEMTAPPIGAGSTDSDTNGSDKK